MKASKIIENEYFLIEVSTTGAELIRLYDKKRELELLYDKSSDWNKQSPLLFPYIGVQKNEYLGIYDDRYKTMRHGFIRDLEFTLEVSSDRIICSRTFQEEFDYPFYFDLTFSYILDNNNLIIEASVLNNSLNTMYYHLGYHPGFNIANNSYIELNSKKHKELILDKTNGLLTKEKIVHKTSTLNINSELFKNDTYITINKYNSLTLYSDNKQLFTLTTNAPVIAFWRKSDLSTYLCIEPWFGICDSLKQGSHITDKKFINRLLPEDVNTHSFKITI